MGLMCVAAMPLFVDSFCFVAAGGLGVVAVVVVVVVAVAVVVTAVVLVRVVG